MRMRKKQLAQIIAATENRQVINSDELYKADKKQIAIKICIVVMVVFCIVGFFLGFNLYEPLDSMQIADCENVAWEVHKGAKERMLMTHREYSAQKTETYSVQKNEKEIRVSQDDHVGIVIASIQNNELTFRYDAQTGRRILYGVGFSIMAVLFALEIISSIAGIIESIQKGYWRVHR